MHYVYITHLLCISKRKKVTFYVVTVYPGWAKLSDILPTFCRRDREYESKPKGWRKQRMITMIYKHADMLQTNTDTLKQTTSVFLSRPILSISIYLVSVSINESVWERSMMPADRYVCPYCIIWQHYVFTAVKTRISSVNTALKTHP